MIESRTRTIVDDSEEVLSAELLYSDEEILDEFGDRCYVAVESHNPANENLLKAAKALARMVNRAQRFERTRPVSSFYS